MYETFVKYFIDIMDERAPVTMVRNRIDMPLGAVQADQSTLIHTRLDLLDDDSPDADVVITQNEGMYTLDFVVHIPADDKLTDEQFMERVRQAGQIDSVSVLQSIDGRHDATYVVTGHLNIDMTDDDQNANSATHQLSELMVALMKAGGYDPVYADDTKIADDIVTWSPE